MQKTYLSQLIPDGHMRHEAESVFAFVTLGVIETLASGSVAADDAIRFYFHADNCQFVRKHLQDKTADEVMSRGVQLQDLFDTLPPREAQKEFQRELNLMRALCLQFLEHHETIVS